jgi:hypothetical protein
MCTCTTFSGTRIAGQQPLEGVHSASPRSKARLRRAKTRRPGGRCCYRGSWDCPQGCHGVASRASKRRSQGTVELNKVMGGGTGQRATSASPCEAPCVTSRHSTKASRGNDACAPPLFAAFLFDYSTNTTSTLSSPHVCAHARSFARHTDRLAISTLTHTLLLLQSRPTPLTRLLPGARSPPFPRERC